MEVLNLTGAFAAQAGDRFCVVFTETGNDESCIVSSCAGKQIAFFQNKNAFVAEVMSYRNSGHTAANNNQVVNHVSRSGSCMPAAAKASARSMQLMHFPQGCL